MRFIALLRKELREALPWILLAAITFLVIGGFLLEERIRRDDFDSFAYRPGGYLRHDWFMRYCELAPVGSWLLVVSLGLGLLLGGRQFALPGFLKTWAFALHRSVPRVTVLAAKLCAAALGFALTVGLIWTLMFLYSQRPGVFHEPPRSRIFVEGLIYIVLGVVAYLGTAASALSRARWYTTKVCGLAIAGCTIILALAQPNLTYCLMTILIGLLLLGAQVVHMFIHREY